MISLQLRLSPELSLQLYIFIFGYRGYGKSEGKRMDKNKFFRDCEMPVVIFHKKQDRVIYYGSSLKLKNEFKKSDILILLED